MIRGSVASCASEARQHCVGIYPQHVRSNMHANHFTFHPMKAVLLYRVITDQSNRLLLELHTKAEVDCTWCHNNLVGPCMDFLVTSYTRAIYCMIASFAKGLRPFRDCLPLYTTYTSLVRYPNRENSTVWGMLSVFERLLFVIRHMPPIVYENGLGPAACAELQIEVAL